MVQDKHIGRVAVSLLATSFVVACGLVVCSFVILAVADQPVLPLLCLLGFFVSVFFLMWSLGEKPRNDTLEDKHFWLARQKKPTHKTIYKLKKQTNQIEEYGSHDPPTAETVRDLRDSPSTWVPSNLPPARRD